LMRKRGVGGEWTLMLPFALENAGSGAELYLNLLLRDIRWLHTHKVNTDTAYDTNARVAYQV
jgi:hypothetical protein